MGNKKLIKRALLETAKPKYNQQNLSRGVDPGGFFKPGIKPTPGMKQQQKSPGYFGGFMRGLFTGDHPLGWFNNLVFKNTFGRFNDMVSNTALNTTSNAGKLGSMTYNRFNGKNANKPALAKSGSALEKRAYRDRSKAELNQHLLNQGYNLDGTRGIRPGQIQQQNAPGFLGTLGSGFSKGMNQRLDYIGENMRSSYNEGSSAVKDPIRGTVRSLGTNLGLNPMQADRVGQIASNNPFASSSILAGVGNVGWNAAKSLKNYFTGGPSKAQNLGANTAKSKPKVPTVENSSFANKYNSAIVGAI